MRMRWLLLFLLAGYVFAGGVVDWADPYPVDPLEPDGSEVPAAACGGGLVGSAFVALSGQSLYYAEREVSGGPEDWSSGVVESAEYEVGHPALAVAPSGTRYILYYRSGFPGGMFRNDLRLATGTGGVGAVSWGFETVASSTVTGEACDIVVDSGFLRIAYSVKESGGARQLRYATRPTTGGGWTTEVVSTSLSLTAALSLGVNPVSGRPAVLFKDAAGFLVYAERVSPGSWQSVVVDSSGEVRSPRLAYSPETGLAWAAYGLGTDRIRVKVARALTSAPLAPEDWCVEPVAENPSGDAGSSVSLAFSADGAAELAFLRTGGGTAVEHIRREPTSSWGVPRALYEGTAASGCALLAPETGALLCFLVGVPLGGSEKTLLVAEGVLVDSPLVVEPSPMWFLVPPEEGEGAGYGESTTAQAPSKAEVTLAAAEAEEDFAWLAAARRRHPRVERLDRRGLPAEGLLTLRCVAALRPDELRRELARLGGELLHVESARRGIYVVALPGYRLDAFAGLPGVVRVESARPERIAHNVQARLAARVNAVEVGVFGLDGDGVSLGMWDEGPVDAAHQEFDGRVIVVEGGAANNHATHVAGTIASAGEHEAASKGAAVLARLYSYDFLGSPAAEMGTARSTYGIVAANNSWGLPLGWERVYLYGDWRWVWYGDDDFGSYTAETAAYDALVKDEGLFIVFSAGNHRGQYDDGWPGRSHYDWTGSGFVQCNDYHPPDGGSSGYGCLDPLASGKNVLCVGSVKETGGLAAYSSTGPTADGRLKPDIVAMGANTSVPVDPYTESTGLLSTFPGNAYHRLSGTSMAAAEVSGAVALLCQAYETARFGEEPSPQALRALLIHGARDRVGGASDLDGPDYAYGFGLLDALASVDAVPGLREASVFKEGLGPTEVEFPFYVPSGEDVKVTLAWCDEPALPGANPTIVDDLDLVLIDPDGVARYPWVGQPASPASGSVRGVNTVDTVEVASFCAAYGDTVPPGLWRARVVGSSLASDEVRFAIVASQPFALPDKRFSIENRTGYEMTVSAVEPGEPWLSVTETDGSPVEPFVVGPYGRKVLVARVDAAGLPPGRYGTTLAVSWEEGDLLVPVTLAVGAEEAGSSCSEHFNLMALSCHPADPAPEAVLSDLVAAGNVLDYNLYAYTPSSGYSVYPTGFSAMEAGRAYWLNVAHPTPYSVEGLLPHRTSWVPLANGWNLVGGLLSGPVEWASCYVSDGWRVLPVAEASSAGWIQSTIFGYVPGSGYYTVTPDPGASHTTLEPFVGYWVKAYRSGLSLVFPSFGPQ